MSAEHHVDVSAVYQLADTFEHQQRPVQALSGPLHQASVNTGAADLDSETKATVGKVADLLTRIGAEFGEVSEKRAGAQPQHPGPATPPPPTQRHHQAAQYESGPTADTQPR